MNIINICLFLSSNYKWVNRKNIYINIIPYYKNVCKIIKIIVFIDSNHLIANKVIEFDWICPHEWLHNLLILNSWTFVVLFFETVETFNLFYSKLKQIFWCNFHEKENKISWKIWIASTKNIASWIWRLLVNI